MHEEILTQAGIDYAEGLQRFAGNLAIYNKYLYKFPQDPNFDGLRNAMQNEDYRDAFRYAHTLKGLTGNLSINLLFEQMRQLTEALRNENDIALAKSLWPAIEKAYQNATASILRAFE